MTNTNLQTTKFNKAIEELRYTTEAFTIRQDVIFWAEEQSQDGYDTKELFNDLMQNGCQSGMVTDLIYYQDTNNFFDEHEKEIKQIIKENFGVEDLESPEGADWLADNFNLLSHDERIDEMNANTLELAEERVCIEHDDWEEMDDSDFQELVEEEFEYLVMYEDPDELTTQDKNALAWMAFEFVASSVYDELLEMVEAE